MTPQDIIEGNKLIDKFMPDYLFDGTDYYYLNISEYHSSWDWLMPVLEQIENTKGKFGKRENSIQIGMMGADNTNVCTIKGCMLSIQHREKTKIEAAYKCVIEFIKLYNNRL